MNLPGYPKYKPSGVDWLGDLPEHWSVKRLKYLAEISTSGVWGEDPAFEGDGCPVATTANISPFGDIDVAGMHTRLLSKEEFRKGLCRPGDTIVVKSSGSASSVISGKCAMVRAEHGEICFSNFTLRVRPIEGRLDPIFAWSFLSSGIVRAQVRLMVSTTTYPNLQVPEYISFLVPQPPPAEQRAIAAFLDRETGRLDRLVAKKRELIERLQEKRAALIAHTVTRGLNPKATLKPSSIEWLGDIPEHWAVCAVRHLFVSGRGRVISHEDIMDNPGEYPVYSSQTEDDGVLGFLGSFDFEGDYITWTTDGANAGTVFRRTGRFNCTNVCGTLKPKIADRVDNAFTTYALNQATGEYVRHDINPKLMNNVMAKIRFGVPPYPEQRAIADYLDRETAKIDALVAKVGEAVERLQEYRTALITAAVTGKIDVRKECHG